MSAMPEREVFATELNEQEWLVSYLREAMKMAEKLVPESALLAAEARVREVELESGSWRRVCERLEREAATLRADREALVQLIDNDAYAVTFQTLGQYRTALLARLRAPRGEDA